MIRRTLKESLVHWQDRGDAAADIAICLGLMEVDDPAGRAKHVFFGTNSEIGHMLYQFVDKLIEAGVLEAEGEYQSDVRWNQSYKGSWED